MPDKKKEHPPIKSKLHPRSKHRTRYDFNQLTTSCPELAPFVEVNQYNDESIDFFNPKAVLMLNTALLKHHYSLDFWAIPKNYLCPPIPGRADYIHHIADFLSMRNGNKIPKGDSFKCLDIGVGANCIYPIIGRKEYGWSFIGSDIDAVAIESATRIVESNAKLKGNIDIRLQNSSQAIFKNIIQEGEYIDLTICNPPFYASLEDALKSTKRKLKNLRPQKNKKPVLNFGGKNNELWCKGGEEKFIRDMIQESKEYSSSCHWFSTLVSKQSNLKGIYKQLRKAKALEVETIDMGQGNKVSRIVVWTFLNPKQQSIWRQNRWK